jgi:ferredoxin
VKLIVDSGNCMGHGRCYTLAPDLLTYDDEGFPSIRDELIAVPDDQLEAADDVAGSCPEGAISLIAE